MKVTSGSVRGNPKSSAVRRPSPIREEREEKTFQEKLSEIKRLREAGMLGSNRKIISESVPSQQTLVKPLKKFIINGKPVQKLLGDWALMQSSKGKPYFFNLKTQISQWTKPQEWDRLVREEKQQELAEQEKILSSAPQDEEVASHSVSSSVKDSEVQISSAKPEMLHPSNETPLKPIKQSQEDSCPKSITGFKMKINSTNSTTKAIIKGAKKSALCQEADSDNLLSKTDSIFEKPDIKGHAESRGENKSCDAVKSKTSSPAKDKDENRSNRKERHRSHTRSPSKSRSRSRSRSSSQKRSRQKRRRSRSQSRDSSRSRSKRSLRVSQSRSRSKSTSSSRSRSKSPVNHRHGRDNRSRSKSPKEKSNQVSSSMPQPVPSPDMSLVLAAKAKIESQMQAGNSLISLLDRNPKGQIVNPTWITEYNFPAVLSRCKFPKVADVLHEIQTNRGKSRNPRPLPMELENSNAGAQQLSDLRKGMFMQELKDSSNRHRLLSEKLGVAVFKIPDELWEQYFNQFQIDLLQGVKLECRPHGVTEDDTPVYTRTGKVATVLPFPEDIVRCHAVVQAWGTQICHCVYANKTYSIERDDRQWKKDLEDCRKFLKENGY